MIISIGIGALGIDTKRLIEGLVNLEIGGQVDIIEISKNTEKSPGDLRIFAVTQTSVKDHQLTLV